MDPQLSQDSLDSLLPLPQVSEPHTPEPPHAQLPYDSATAISKLQSNRLSDANNMTPPPSTQVVPSSQRAKTRTPTPTMSHISTPPPTVELPSQSQNSRIGGRFAVTMTAEQIGGASIEELRSRMTEMQGALHEAKMTAAHHKLQYQMLAQESEAHIERMTVEARMAQFENEVIHNAEQAKAAATPVQQSPFHGGMIPVQKDLYQRMCREIQQLTEERNWLADEQAQKDKTIGRQDLEIASLLDRVELMRERIREASYRKTRPVSRLDGTPRSQTNSMHQDALRTGVPSYEQPQPFAALLQASEMASQEARRPTHSKKGHFRNAQSTSSLPATPQRGQKQQPPHVYQTPYNRHRPAKIPSTAPLPRTNALRTPDVYAQNALPVSHQAALPGALSDGTVSASEDGDSEAETDIIEPDSVTESQASLTASQMLRTSQKEASFQGRGMLAPSPPQSQLSIGSSAEKMRQSKLYGVIRKAGAERSGDEPPAKKARTVGLGIAGVRD